MLVLVLYLTSLQWAFCLQDMTVSPSDHLVQGFQQLLTIIVCTPHTLLNKGVPSLLLAPSLLLSRCFC